MLTGRRCGGTDLDKYLALPFGIGVALVLDESALLLELDDVYWTEEESSASRSSSPRWRCSRRSRT